MRRMKINGKKIFISVIVCGLMVLFLGAITTSKPADSRADQHNCRFWGLVFRGELGTEWEQKVQTHLEQLKQLSDENDDGWGIGYYILSPEQTQISLLPVISRGEPKALNDQTRYDNVVDELIDYVKKGSIAHVWEVETGTGPIIGLPDPHPFRRKALYRDFDMLFAHNGNIPEDFLLYFKNELIGNYIDLNPTDYTDDDLARNPKLGADLFAIYIMKVIDDGNTESITDCIIFAVNNLEAKLDEYGYDALLNFVMTDGFTLWALRYAEQDSDAYTLYYYPNAQVKSNKWVAASEEMDNDSRWEDVDNYTLVVLRPGEPPEEIDLSP